MLENTSWGSSKTCIGHGMNILFCFVPLYVSHRARDEHIVLLYSHIYPGRKERKKEKKRKGKEKNAFSRLFLFFGVGSNIFTFSFMQFCSRIIHQFILLIRLTEPQNCINETAKLCNII